MEMVRSKIFIKDIVQTTNRNGSENYSCKRVARGKHMNILTLDGMTKRKIPVYTKGCIERDELIKNYYKYCNIVESEIQENNL